MGCDIHCYIEYKPTGSDSWSDFGGRINPGWMYVCEPVGEGCCTPSRAEAWVERGSSRYKDAEKMFVSNPDWHSHSWLTTDEYASVVEGTGEPEYEAILAAMRSFEEGGAKARIVFWFDNCPL